MSTDFGKGWRRNPGLSPIVIPDPVPTDPRSLKFGKISLGAGTRALDSVAQTQEERETTVGGWGSTIPLVYGTVKLGATIPFAKILNNTELHYLAAWSMGECGGVQSLEFEDKDQSEVTGITIANYTGTDVQTYPAGLHALMPTYADNLPAVAYSYIILSKNCEFSGLPDTKAIFDGRKLYDPRTTLTEFSDNPALALADFMWHAHGMGYGFDAIDWDSVETCADYCDEDVNGKPRHTISLVLRDMLDVIDQREVLRAYAHVFLYQENGKIVMVPDAPRAVDHYFTKDDIIPGSLVISTLKETDIPNVVEVVFTDAENGYVDANERVVSGDETRTAIYRMEGIPDRSEAKRECYLRLNKPLLGSRQLRVGVFAKGSQVTPGDVIQIDHDTLPLTEAKFRISRVTKTGLDEWNLAGEAYDPDMYGDQVAEPPEYTPITWADPYAPPEITGLILTEEIAVARDGTVFSQVKAVWDDPEYPYLDVYLVEIYKGGIYYHRAPIIDNVFTHGPLVDGVDYEVRVYVKSTAGVNIISDYVSDTLTAQGKALPPGDVPSIYQALPGNDWVLLKWNKAIDIDIIDYEVRRGSTSDDWDSASFVGYSGGSLHFRDDRVPAGTYRYFIKAVDSVKNVSTNAKYIDVTVVAYDTQYVGNNEWTAEDFALTGMSAYYVRGVGWFIAPDDDEDWGEGFTQPDNDLDDWQELGDVPFMLPRTDYGGTVVAETDTWDLGVSKTGTWNISGFLTTLVENGDNGGIDVGILLGAADPPTDEYNATSALGAGRYARIYLEDTSDGPDAGWVIQILPAIMGLVAMKHLEVRRVLVEASPNQPYLLVPNYSYSEIEGVVPVAEGDGSGLLSAQLGTVSVDEIPIYVLDKSDNQVEAYVNVFINGA